MFKIMFDWLWSARRQLVRYFIVGVSGFCLDVFTLYRLKEYCGLNPVLAVVINQLLIINLLFLANKFWTFKSKGAAPKQAAKFYAVMGFNYIVAISWMWLFNNQLGLNYLIARAANIVLSVSWNFLLYRYFVFAVPVNKTPQELPNTVVE